MKGGAVIQIAKDAVFWRINLSRGLRRGSGQVIGDRGIGWW